MFKPHDPPTRDIERRTLKEVSMPWFSSRATKPQRVHRFEQADPVVVKLFADLQRARNLKSNRPSRISILSIQRLERQAWMQLIDYLAKLPPLPNGD
jgi:hypothetical protein